MKKAKIASRKQNQVAAPKDDGRRFIVVRDGRQVYPGPGVPFAAAQFLEAGLVRPAEIVELAKPEEEVETAA